MANGLVADLVSVVVVDLLEVVDVEGQNGEGLLAGSPLLQGDLQAAAVEQAAEGVGQAVEVELADLLLQQGQSGEQGALELGGLVIPRTYLAELLAGRRRVQLPGGVGQLAQRLGDQARQSPDGQQAQ
ncbi:hypothetical protein D3C72_1806250 [compost metagenome]